MNAVFAHQKQCERHPGAEFRVVKIWEMADGLLCVQDDERELTLYFDKSKLRTMEGYEIEDTGLQIVEFPEGVGFVVNVMAKGTADMKVTAELYLRRTTNRPVRFLKAPRLLT